MNDLFDAGYNAWIKACGDQAENALAAIKIMSHIAIYSGLNRRVSKKVFSNFIEKEKVKISISPEEAFELLKKEYSYVEFEGEELYFSVTAFLEYFWAKFVFEEIREHGNTIRNYEKSFIREYRINPEMLDSLYAMLRSEPEMAQGLKELILCTRDKQSPERYKYTGGNSLSLLCRLYAVNAFRNVLDMLKQSRDSFQRLNLSGADLRHMDFRNCNFSYSTLDEVDFSFAQLASAVFDTTILRNIKHQEYGDMRTCAFADIDPLKIVAGTETGELLLYRKDDDSKTAVKAHARDGVTDVCVQGSLVYTAGEDGYIMCYDVASKIDEKWQMRSSALVQALDSTSDTLYAGTRTQGVYRVKQFSNEEETVVWSVQDNEEDAVWIMSLRAFDHMEKTNLAIALADGEVVIINTETAERLTVRTAAKITGMCVTETDILYVDDRQAIYGTALSGLNVRQPRVAEYRRLTGVVGIAYAKNEGRVYCLRKLGERYRIDRCDTSTGSWDFSQIDIEAKLPTEIKAFAVSDCGNHIAFAGDQLALVKRDTDGAYYGDAKPIDIKMNCKDMVLTNSKGLSKPAEAFFHSKGAGPYKK